VRVTYLGQVTQKTILQVGLFAFVVAAYIGEADRPLKGMVALLSVLVVWFPVARYRPASGWPRRLRNGACAALAVYGVSLFVLMRSAQSFTARGCFWMVQLPFGHWVYAPPPYDRYVKLLTIYLSLTSITLTVACMAACLCVWSLGKLKARALPLATPLSR